MQAHHRRAQTHAGDLGVKAAFEGAGIVGHIGRGAAHVEADQMLKPGFAPDLGHADHSARRS